MAAPTLRVRALVVGTDQLFHGWAVAERVVDGVVYCVETVGMHASDAFDAMSALGAAGVDAAVAAAIAERKVKGGVQ